MVTIFLCTPVFAELSKCLPNPLLLGQPVEILCCEIPDCIVWCILVNVMIFPVRNHMSLMEKLERWDGPISAREVPFHEVRVCLNIQ